MVSWRQFWYGSWVTREVSEEDFFSEFDVRPGWEKEVVLIVLGRALCFVYPGCPEAMIRGSERVL